jgi:hypothetical protein
MIKLNTHFDQVPVAVVMKLLRERNIDEEVVVGETPSVKSTGNRAAANVAARKETKS